MLVVLIVVVCVVSADANIHYFVSMMRDYLKIHLDDTWSFIKNAFKRPVRVRKTRMQNVGTTSSMNTQQSELQELELVLLTMTTTATTVTTPKTVPPDMMYYFQRPKHKQILLPIIINPTWHTRDDWLNLQQLNTFVRRGVHGIRERDRSTEKYAVKYPPDDDELAAKLYDDSDKSDEDVGVMMFI